MSEDDRRHPYEDAPFDGLLDHGANGAGNGHAPHRPGRGHDGYPDGAYAIPDDPDAGYPDLEPDDGHPEHGRPDLGYVDRGLLDPGPGYDGPGYADPGLDAGYDEHHGATYADHPTYRDQRDGHPALGLDEEQPAPDYFGVGATPPPYLDDAYDATHEHPAADRHAPAGNGAPAGGWAPEPHPAPGGPPATGGDRVVALTPPPGGGRRRKPRLKKLRLLVVLLPLLLLAVVSAVFGMIMAIASDLPALENRAEYRAAKNSVLLDINGKQIGVLTGRDNRILVASGDIPFVMKRAMISVEDQRFYTNSGIDLKGIARAFVADIFKQRAAQGASTITQQFVKNALRAQNKRTVFEKLREAALAYHLTRKWTKDKILTEYLNSIYFGNGAYGIESAARTYFGHDSTTSQYNCGTTGQPLCVHGLVAPDEAALLAGMVASPSAYDPVAHPRAARLRRNLVLRDMYRQGYLPYAEYQDALNKALPARANIIPPQEKVIEPGVAYFTTWVKQQLVDRYHVPEAFDGGLVVHTTLDYELQQKAEQAVAGYLPGPDGPSAAMVVIDNATGEVRALVGGRDFNTQPFNLATQGQRQPGSAFKAFVLAQALKEGISPDSVWPSQKVSFVVPGTRGREHFVVNNYEGAYAGSRSLADATTVSDNSVFAQVGIKAGTPRIAALAKAAGIRTPVSTNPAIVLGGLHTGVTPLDMAHAYETIAHDGQRVYGTLGAPSAGPVGIHSVDVPGQSHPDRNRILLRRVIPSDVDQTEQSILHTVVTSGTAKAADFGTWAAGKTGTTENYGDAWFVGFTHGDATHPGLTVAVWVGYPDRLRSMSTDFNGSPVAGGTFPALIWHDFMVAAAGIYDNRAAQRAAKAAASQTGTSTTSTDTTSAAGPASSGPTTTRSTPPSSAAGNAGATNGPGPGAVTGTPPAQTPAPTQAAPAPAPATPTPTPATPPPATPSPAGAAPANPGASSGAGASGGAQGPSG